MFARNTVQIARRSISTSTRCSAAPDSHPHAAPFPGQKDPREFAAKDTAWKTRKTAFMGISPVYAAFGTISILAIGAYVNYSMKDNTHERPRTGVPQSKELKDAIAK
ncbi:uncharacterized protein JCM15063_003623 [Sporobolomyces koalae]|uniref:uncharacterized protein n=1 Tax=Sporobolomyces koalae TaxID=500713 RepID=UPI00316D817E